MKIERYAGLRLRPDCHSYHTKILNRDALVLLIHLGENWYDEELKIKGQTKIKTYTYISYYIYDIPPLCVSVLVF